MSPDVTTWQATALDMTKPANDAVSMTARNEQSRDYREDDPKNVA